MYKGASKKGSVSAYHPLFKAEVLSVKQVWTPAIADPFKNAFRTAVQFGGPLWKKRAGEAFFLKKGENEIHGRKGLRQEWIINIC